MFTDITDVFKDSGLNEDVDKVQEYLSSIKVVQYADATLSQINYAAENIQYTKETASYVYDSLPNVGLSSFFSKISSSMTGGNNQLTTINPEVIEVLDAGNMKELFVDTGDAIINIVEIIIKTVKLYNNLSPKARIIMNERLQKNKTQTLQYRLNKDIRTIPLYNAYSSLFNQNKSLLMGGSMPKSKSKSRSRKNSSKRYNLNSRKTSRKGYNLNSRKLPEKDRNQGPEKEKTK